MARPRGRKGGPAAASAQKAGEREPGLDVNAVVSFNVRAIRERRGLTQQAVAEGLAQLTGHLLPQASISAMERGFDGERRRRFDAHELYLLSVVFDVPIAYFFVPPPGSGVEELADTHRPVAELYAALLGKEAQLGVLDERLADNNLTNPQEMDDLLVALFGAEGAAGNWHAHFRTWRKQRLAELAKTYGDRLDGVAEVLAEFSQQVKTLGPSDYLQAMAHKSGEAPLDEPIDEGA